MAGNKLTAQEAYQLALRLNSSVATLGSLYLTLRVAFVGWLKKVPLPACGAPYLPQIIATAAYAAVTIMIAEPSVRNLKREGALFEFSKNEWIKIASGNDQKDLIETAAKATEPKLVFCYAALIIAIVWTAIWQPAIRKCDNISGLCAFLPTQKMKSND